ncbi:response regulator transcription factor [Devosia aurantiaca]|uniref:Response regulator n=1 Tax=Devosia aurantiaca TaxID=2714858 RepID=A0A6M1SH74_9HYPH|nr:LuxR C-terminal-related transcriptional regulator [Devosia aurantiaca]NGP18807.1 response regulator [Devosia aurantiaca]
MRQLHDTSFPILDENGAVYRIAGITEDLTPDISTQVYLICGRSADARRLANALRSEGFTVRVFQTAEAFLNLAPVLVSGCVLVDLQTRKSDGLQIPRELKSRAIDLPTILLDRAGVGVEAAVTAMKAGASDYLVDVGDPGFETTIASAIRQCSVVARPATAKESALGRVGRLTAREHDVPVGLVEGGTNKSIAQKLGISPRTVELHRAQLMHRLDASTLTELLQIALASGLAPSQSSQRL